MAKLASALVSRLVIIVPYAWLLFFFLIPFFIVFRISLSQTADCDAALYARLRPGRRPFRHYGEGSANSRSTTTSG